MIKFIRNIIFLLITVNIYSRNLESIKKSDTIYIYFKKDEKNQLYNKVNSLKNLLEEYFFRSIDSKYTFMYFTHNFENLKEEKIVKRNLLLKKKDIIITYKFLTQFNSIDASELIVNKKKVFN